MSQKVYFLRHFYYIKFYHNSTILSMNVHKAYMDLENNAGRKILLQTYGVEIITESVNDSEYRNYYNRMIDFLEGKIKD